MTCYDTRGSGNLIPYENTRSPGDCRRQRVSHPGSTQTQEIDAHRLSVLAQEPPNPD